MHSTVDEYPSSGTCPTPTELVRNIIALTDESENASQVGTFSGAVYDTAWLSMITKRDEEDDKRHRHYHVFPECFNYLLQSQQSDGAWGATGSPIDGILNSLAGLLALASRLQDSGTTESPGPNSLKLQQKIQRGHTAVQNLLQSWDVSSCVHVGFEILVPSLLRQLETYDLCFDFPGRSALMTLNEKKLRKFHPKMVYSPEATTLLHSLEAFVGLVDFDKVSHHCNAESGMFGSPSSTAAYLMNSTSWDKRAETYLKMVVSTTKGTGFVPSAYPTGLFELSWSLSTLLVPRISLQQPLTETEAEKLRHIFERPLREQNGVVGFTPGVLADADDTARCLMALQCLGKAQTPDKLIEMFRTDSHFRTYKLEGNPSFSANCNVLLALLGCVDVDHYEQLVEKALMFLLQLEQAGPISDKWNLSSQYSRMLFIQTMILLLEKYDSGHLQTLSTTVVFQQVLSSICRQLDETLSAQELNGSWADSTEITAYSIVTIVYCLSLPWSPAIKTQLNESISRGRQFLYAEYGSSKPLEYLWVEKVSYRSTLLHSVYCSAALNIDPIQRNWSSTISEHLTLRDGTLKQTKRLLSMLPLFRDCQIPCLELVLIEANFMAGQLKESRNVLFSRDDIPMTADKYTDFIPMIWVACNHKNKFKLSAHTVWEMVLLSLFNFQLDEYMESVVARIPESQLPQLSNLLKRELGVNDQSDITSGDQSMQKGHTNGFEQQYHDHMTAATAFQPLKRYIHHVLQHESIRQSPVTLQREISKEIHNFLIAHIVHNQDNISLAKSRNAELNGKVTSTTNDIDYITWVRTSASDDTSCPLSFLIFSSLISEPARNCFESAQARYFSRSLCRHLATMCRQYNDYGSAIRDAEEGNLNSLDFPEFKAAKVQQPSSNIPTDETTTTTKNGSPSTTTNGNSHAPHEQPPSNTNGDSHPRPRSGEEVVVTNGDSNGPIHPSPHSSTIDPSSKETLMAIAEFERSCMNLAQRQLNQTIPLDTARQLQVFIDVTDMFGQVYVQKDIASRVVKKHA